MRTEQMLRPDRILRRQDFAGGCVTLAIAGVTQEAVGTGRYDLAWLLHFDETEQCLMLDPTSIRQLEAALGPTRTFGPAGGS